MYVSVDRGQLAYILKKVKRLAHHEDMLSRHKESSDKYLENDDCIDISKRKNLKLMHNFRELLWFWGEYYLRRGRDRLSVAFSSHIPFSYWERLVGKSILRPISNCMLNSHY